MSKKKKDFTIYADERTSAARKEMLSIFTGTYAVEENDVIDYLLLAQVLSTKSEIVMQVLEKTLLEKGTDLSNTRFSCLDGTSLYQVNLMSLALRFTCSYGTNSISGELNVVSFKIYCSWKS